MPSLRHEMAVGLIRAQPRLRTLNVEAGRLLMDDFARLLPMPDRVARRAERIGRMEAEWLLPLERPGERAGAGATPPTVLYLHGGGYCMGSIASHRALAARVGLAAACRVLLIDYRLAPEQPFPAALDDARAAYEWLLERGGDHHRLLVAGDSAGGGLALALLLDLARDGRPQPGGAVCLSPWADLTLSGESATSGLVDDPMVSLEDARLLADLYLQGHEPTDPLASPLFGDPRGLPPLLFQVGTRELLLDDSRRFTAAARRAGVDVTLEEWDGLMHVWHVLAPMVPEAVDALASVGRWVRRLAKAPPGGERPSAA